MANPAEKHPDIRKLIMLNLAELPVFDEQVLAHVLGVDSIESAMDNAVVWLEQAYKDGKEAGVREERKEWESKIRKLRKLFGI